VYENSREINFNKKLLFPNRNILHDRVCNEQTNEEIPLINKICRELKEKNENIFLSFEHILNTANKIFH